MTRSSVKITETPYALLAESSKGGTRLVKAGGSFFEPPAAVFEKIRSEGEAIDERIIGDSPALLVCTCLLIAASLAAYFLVQGMSVVEDSLAIAMIFLLANIVIHEASHAAVLKVLYPKAKMSCGFKMMFIFPAFYVDTSDSYLLPPCKRITVYLAGIAGNAIFVLLSVILIPDFAHYDYLVVSTLLVNLIPIMRGDGYYILLTLMKKRNAATSKKATFWRDFARGATMLLIFLGISFISHLGW